MTDAKALDFEHYGTREEAQAAVNQVIRQGMSIQEGRAILSASGLTCANAFSQAENAISKEKRDILECSASFPIGLVGKATIFVDLYPDRSEGRHHLIEKAVVSRNTTFL
jgi:hypothetical protein